MHRLTLDPCPDCRAPAPDSPATAAAPTVPLRRTVVEDMLAQRLANRCAGYVQDGLSTGCAASQVSTHLLLCPRLPWLRLTLAGCAPYRTVNWQTFWSRCSKRTPASLPSCSRHRCRRRRSSSSRLWCRGSSRRRSRRRRSRRPLRQQLPPAAAAAARTLPTSQRNCLSSSRGSWRRVAAASRLPTCSGRAAPGCRRRSPPTGASPCWRWPSPRCCGRRHGSC